MSKSQFKSSQWTLSKAEVSSIYNSPPNFRDRVIIKALYFAGLRRFEVTALRVGDVDFSKGCIWVRHGKRDKLRIVPIIDQDFKADLKHLIGKRTEGVVFQNKGLGGKLSERSINNIVDSAAVRAGVSNPNPNPVIHNDKRGGVLYYKRHINPHIFRHSIARHLKNDKWPMEWIQNFLGHDSMNTTTDTYGTMGIEEMMQYAAAKLNLSRSQDKKEIE